MRQTKDQRISVFSAASREADLLLESYSFDTGPEVPELVGEQVDKESKAAYIRRRGGPHRGTIAFTQI